MLTLQQADRSDIHVAIVCALTLEADAVHAVLDSIDVYDERGFERAPGDLNSYTLGTIQDHNVVVVHLGGMGLMGAATASAAIGHSFPNVRLALVVGICGGVPVLSNGTDILLGDLIVSTCLVQYDFGWQYDSAFERKRDIEDAIGRPHPSIRSFLSKLQTRLIKQSLRSDTFASLHRLIATYPEYALPTTERTSLFEPSYIHKHRPTDPGLECKECDANVVCKEAREASCRELGCREDEQLSRSRSGEDYSQARPAIHFGRVGCGNTVMKSGTYRDMIARAENLIAFEMESASVWDCHPTLVVKAVCDYADSHKNKAWQKHAAAVAAAGAKAILQHWPSQSRSRNISRPKPDSEPINKHWLISRELSTWFTGREDTVQWIESILRHHFARTCPTSPCRVVITGSGGQGKSELCLKLAKLLRQSFWGVFWIDVSTHEQTVKGYKDVATRIGGCVDSLEYAKSSLENISTPWLLILDNADDVERDYQEYLPSSDIGAVLLTSRNHQCSRYASPNSAHCTLEGLNKAAAEELVLHITDEEPGIHTSLAVRAICELLDYHTLALVQAGSYIRKGFCKLSEYPTKFEQNKRHMMKQHETQARSRHGSVYATFEISASSLSHNALQLLGIMSMWASSPFPVCTFKVVWHWALEIIRRGPTDTDVRYPTSWHAHRLIDLMGLPAPTSSDITAGPRRERAIGNNNEEIQIQNSSSGSAKHQEVAEEFESTRLMGAVDLLCALALFKLDKRKDDLYLTMHPLVHEWARVRQVPWLRKFYWISAACFFTFSAETVLWDQYSSMLQPHLLSLTDGLSGMVLVQEPQLMIAKILYALADLLSDEQLHVHLRMLLAQLPSDFTMPSTIYNPLATHFYTLLAFSHWYAGDNIRAEAQFLDIRKFYQSQGMATTHGDFLDVEYHIGRTQNKCSEYATSVKTLEAVHRTYAQGNPAGKYDVLTIQRSFAIALSANDQLPQCIELLEDAHRQLIDRNDFRSGTALFCKAELARALIKNGQGVRSIDLLEQTIEVEQETLARNHPDLLISQTLLAKAFLHDGRRSEAIELLEQVIEVRQRTLPKNHPSLLSSQMKLARAYLADEKVSQALDLFELVVKIRQLILPETDSLLLDSQFSLATAYMQDGQMEKALDILQHVTSVRRRVLPETDSDRLLSEYSFARAHLFCGDPPSAIILLEHIVGIEREILPESDQNRLLSEDLLAFAFHLDDRSSDAVLLSAHVVLVQERHLSVDDSTRINSENWFVKFLRGCGQLERACSVNKRIVQARRKVLPADHEDRIEAEELQASLDEERRQEMVVWDAWSGLWGQTLSTIDHTGELH